MFYRKFVFYSFFLGLLVYDNRVLGLFVNLVFSILFFLGGIRERKRG